jgi:hypothetical protein
MTKLKLAVEPTFKGIVQIPRAGDVPVPVEFIFKHRTKDDLKKWIDKRKGTDDTTSFLDMCVGWELEDKFDKQHVELLLQNYAGAGLACFKAYLEQLISGRVGN